MPFAVALQSVIRACMFTRFLVAMQLLTIFPGRKKIKIDSTICVQSATYFPIVGLILGTSTWTVSMLLEPLLSPLLRDITAMSVLAIIGRTFLGATRIDDFDHGNDGLVPTSLSMSNVVLLHGTLLVLKIYALHSLHGGYRDAGLLLAPMLGRWAWVVLAYSSRIGPDQNWTTLLIKQIQFNEFALASLIALGTLFTLTSIVGIALAIPLGGLIILSTLRWNARQNGVTANNFQMLGECVETTALLLLSLIGTA